jgi:hypothetical protein
MAYKMGNQGLLSNERKKLGTENPMSSKNITVNFSHPFIGFLLFSVLARVWSSYMDVLC